MYYTINGGIVITSYSIHYTKLYEEIGVKEPVEIENDSTHRVYFGTITTICADLLEFIDPDDNSLCDRHFINDDTLECKLVREEVKVKEETCPNPNGEEGICYNFDRLGGRCVITSYSIHYTKLYENILELISNIFAICATFIPFSRYLVMSCR